MARGWGRTNLSYRERFGVSRPYLRAESPRRVPRRTRVEAAGTDVWLSFEGSGYEPSAQASACMRFCQQQEGVRVTEYRSTDTGVSFVVEATDGRKLDVEEYRQIAARFR